MNQLERRKQELGEYLGLIFNEEQNRLQKAQTLALAELKKLEPPSRLTLLETRMQAAFAKFEQIRKALFNEAKELGWDVSVSTNLGIGTFMPSSKLKSEQAQPVIAPFATKLDKLVGLRKEAQRSLLLAGMDDDLKALALKFEDALKAL
jgi:hypothetical protein